jgi:Transcription factor WhiB
VISVADVGWQAGAECAGADFDFVPRVEDRLGLETARSTWCNVCPVRPECLLYALLYNEHGYWGGTLTAERRKLSKRRDRAKCPVCLSKAVIRPGGGHEICQSCGVSWAGSPDPRLPQGEAVG